MNKGLKITQPQYLLVARDVACKIADGLYREGDRIYARSALASQYGVSSETARRAMCVLDDLGIIEASKGSGIRIISYQKAVDYVRHCTEFSGVRELRDALLESAKRQREESANIERIVDSLIKKTERFSTSNPFVPFHSTIDERCCAIGKTLAELNFWHNTLATVVALRRGDQLMLSPGPHIALQSADVLFYIGDSGCIDRVAGFLASPTGAESARPAAAKV